MGQHKPSNKQNNNEKENHIHTIHWKKSWEKIFSKCLFFSKIREKNSKWEFWSIWEFWWKVQNFRIKSYIFSCKTVCMYVIFFNVWNGIHISPYLYLYSYSLTKIIGKVFTKTLFAYKNFFLLSWPFGEWNRSFWGKMSIIFFLMYLVCIQKQNKI